MGAIDFAVAAGFAFGTLAVALGFALAADPWHMVSLARWFFLVGAFIFALTAVVWGINTSAPWEIRWSLCGGIGLLTILGAVEGFRLTPKIADAGKTTSRTNSAIISIGAPHPKLAFRKTERRARGEVGWSPPSPRLPAVKGLFSFSHAAWTTTETSTGHWMISEVAINFWNGADVPVRWRILSFSLSVNENLVGQVGPTDWSDAPRHGGQFWTFPIQPATKIDQTTKLVGINFTAEYEDGKNRIPIIRRLNREIETLSPLSYRERVVEDDASAKQ